MTIDEKRKAIQAHCYKIKGRCDECRLNEYVTKNATSCIGTTESVENNYNYLFGDTPNQEAKADAGKPKLTLVPQQILYDIAEVREYGCKKYHNPDNWKQVEKQRYRDAAFRHFLAYLREPSGVDEESGIAHLKHLACNIAFLCELEKENQE